MNVNRDCQAAIIIPCKNEGIQIKQTLDFLLQTEAKYMAHIIVIDDNSVDNCCEFLKKESRYNTNVSLIQASDLGAARARNLGVSFAGAAEILIFCDAHITMEKGWLNNILKVFEDKEAGAVCPGIGNFNPITPAGYGQTMNEKFEIYWLKKPKGIEEIPLAPGGCVALRKEIFEAVGGFDRGFLSWGFEDVELSIKLWLFGYKIFVHPEVRIGHKFRRVRPYNVDLTKFYYNKLRMALSHFNYSRVSKLASSMYTPSIWPKLLEQINSSDTYKQRVNYFGCRLHDDDWFFEKFNIPF